MALSRREDSGEDALLLSCLSPEVTYTPSIYFPLVTISHGACLYTKRLGTAVQLWAQEEEVGE